AETGGVSGEGDGCGGHGLRVRGRGRVPDEDDALLPGLAQDGAQGVHVPAPAADQQVQVVLGEELALVGEEALADGDRLDAHAEPAGRLEEDGDVPAELGPAGAQGDV